jgi:hypothetical protein
MTVERPEEATACAITEDDQAVGSPRGHDTGWDALSSAVNCVAVLGTPVQGNRPVRGRVAEVKRSADREGEAVTERGDGRLQCPVGWDRCESHTMSLTASAGLDENQLF